MNKNIILTTVIGVSLLGIVYIRFINSNHSKGKTMTPSITASPASSAISTYSLADVSKHSTGSDCWMAIDTNVYNVSKFTSQHPRGTDYLKGCGTDASSLFNTVRKHLGVTQILRTFRIGNLVNK